MAAVIDRLLANPVGVFGRLGGIALFSCVRLVRNLDGRDFPGAASAEEKRELCTLVGAALTSSGLPGADGTLFSALEDLTETERKILVERRHVPPAFVAEPAGRAVALSPDERWSIAVNGDDALNIRVFRPGCALGEAWAEASALDDELNRGFAYAFDERLGYLTAHVNDVGTAMRASVFLHLPGIAVSGQSAAAIAQMDAAGLELAGVDFGGEKPPLFFRLANRHTLGDGEVRMIEEIEAAAALLVGRETQTRKTLFEREQQPILDLIGRSYGVLQHAHRLDRREAEKCLSGVRLGVDMRLFKALNAATLNSLLLETGSAHLRYRAGREIGEDDEAVLRAALCRSRL